MDKIAVALAYYRQHYGPFTRAEMEAAANPRRNWHTLAEMTSLKHAGIDPLPPAPRPGVFDMRRQLGRAPTAAEYRAARGFDR